MCKIKVASFKDLRSCQRYLRLLVLIKLVATLQQVDPGPAPEWCVLGGTFREPNRRTFYQEQ